MRPFPNVLALASSRSDSLIDMIRAQQGSDDVDEMKGDDGECNSGEIMQ